MGEQERLKRRIALQKMNGFEKSGYCFGNNGLYHEKNSHQTRESDMK